MTSEKNDQPPEPPAETTAPAPGEKKDGCRNGCLAAFFVVPTLLFVVLMLLPPLGQPSEHSCAVDCFGNLMQDWRILRWGLSDDNGDEAWTPPPDWTLVDLIHEYESRKYDYPPVFRGCIHIRPQTWMEEIRGIRDAERQHYLMFPVPASVVFDDSLQPSVPILMCPPGAHREFGTNVLYSNGDVKTLTLEEAEKLVAEQSPVPLEIVFETGLAGPDKKDDRK